jgi:glycosyltransferase involved in cell wall biosynthesis
MSKARLSVLHVGKFYPPYPGGIETHVKTLAEELVRSIEVRVLVAGERWRARSAVENGVEVTRLAMPAMVHGTPIVPRMARAIRAADPDLVHLHFPNPMAALACLSSRLAAPIVIAWHSDVVRQRRAAALFAPLLSLLLRRCGAIIVAADANIDSSPVLNARRELCRVIPYGIRPRGPGLPDPVRVAELRRRHGDRIVLGVGRLIYYKGFEYLVRAMTMVRGTALIAGDGPLRAALVAEAARLGVSDRVVLLGRTTEDELNALYRTCDVFVLPSVERSEAFGIVQLEAMACGKPVVNTRIASAVPHVSLDGITGFTVAPRDPTALASALNALLDDPARRAALGEAARRRAREEFSVELMAARTLEAYREVLAASGGGGGDFATRAIASSRSR